MLGFLKMTKLDLFTIKPQFLSYLAVIPIALMYGFMTHSPVAVISINIAWVEVLLLASIFAIQEKNGLDRLYGSLSMNLNEIILGRYIFALFFYTISFIGSIGVFAILIRLNNISILDTLTGFCISLAYFSINTGIQFPIYFKLGYMKARFWFLFVFIPLLFVMLPLIPVLYDPPQWFQSNRYIIITVSILASFLIQFISYKISLIFYRNRI